jgi:ATPase subunit of ABC transporter with duplicated ATPase domains
MISLSNVGKHFGDQTLFENVSLHFVPGERYGIVGANGCGKSTLLKMLSGAEGASGGEISVPKRATLGVLRQDHFRFEDDRIIDVVMMGSEAVYAAMAEREEILAHAEEHFDGDRYAELEDVIVRGDGYTLESRAGEILEGLGIETAVHQQPLSTLSGGFKLRVLLAQVLAARPDALLLDEPTNHLDILSIRWLEKFLGDFPGVAILVSHDHRFLDNVASVIVDVDYGTVKAYTGNYEAFVRAKQEERARREREIEKREAEIAEHKKFVERFRAKATKARQAQSKLKAIDRIQIDTLPKSSRRYPRFRFEQRRKTGRQVLAVDGIAKSYGDKVVLKDVSLEVMRGERVAIIGPNGIGKSTLLKIAVGEIAADAGSAEWGYETYPGYVAQDQRAQIGSQRQTVEDWLGNFCPGEPIGFVKGHLGAVLFSGDEAEKKLAALSGGEAARLMFARQAVEKPNVLVLDEPTNHLDLEAIEALVTGLRDFDGTLIFVSHDRWFTAELATRVIEITPSGFNDFPGTYEEFVERCADDHLDARAVLQKAREEKREAKAAKGKRRAARKAPSAAGRRRRLAGRLEELTAAIETSESRIDQLNQRFSAADFYGATPHDERIALESEHRDLSEKLRELMAEWEAAETELAALPAD